MPKKIFLIGILEVSKASGEERVTGTEGKFARDKSMFHVTICFSWGGLILVRPTVEASKQASGSVGRALFRKAAAVS